MGIFEELHTAGERVKQLDCQGEKGRARNNSQTSKENKTQKTLIFATCHCSRIVCVNLCHQLFAQGYLPNNYLVLQIITRTENDPDPASSEVPKDPNKQSHIRSSVLNQSSALCLGFRFVLAYSLRVWDVDARLLNGCSRRRSRQAPAYIPMMDPKSDSRSLTLSLRV